MNHIAQPFTPVQPAIPSDTERRRLASRLGFGAAATLAALVAIGVWGHLARHDRALATRAAAQHAVPVVHTQTVRVLDGPQTVDLSANLQAFDTATLFARATGYIGQRNVDIGSHVHAGDVLATIAAPDLDQQLAQAQAQLMQLQAALIQAQANASLAGATNARTTTLVQQGWTSRQQGDTTRLGLAANVAAVGAAEANLRAQQANVGRLRQLVGYERIVAPYDGVITSRQVDVGNLVTANANSGTPLFTIDRTGVLRVQVYVPQEYFFGLKDGETANVTVPQLPGRDFHGVVERTASALSANTRTVLTEIDISNADNTLAPGLYGIVHIAIPRRAPVFVIPSSAVIFNAGGLDAAVVMDGHVRLRHLDLAQDDGAEVEVRAGLAPGDQVILNPPVNLDDGMAVSAEPAAPVKS